MGAIYGSRIIKTPIVIHPKMLRHFSIFTMGVSVIVCNFHEQRPLGLAYRGCLLLTQYFIYKFINNAVDLFLVSERHHVISTFNHMKLRIWDGVSK